MSCRRAFEVDLASFLTDPRGAAWAEFRDHYPRCPTCAAEVRAWTELELALGNASHPEPEELLRWTDEAPDLAPTRRRAIGDHVARCAPCRDEAHALRRLDPFAAPGPERGAAHALRLRWPGLRWLVWNPALAYAVALVVGLYPLLADRQTQPLRAPRAARDSGEADTLATIRKNQDQPAAAPPEAQVRNAAKESLGQAMEPARREPEAKTVATGSFAPASRADALAIPVVVLRRDGEVTVTRSGDHAQIELRVEPAPPGVTHVRVSDAARQRTLGAPGEASIRVPSAWLESGRYVVELLDGDRAIATARLVVTP